MIAKSLRVEILKPLVVNDCFNENINSLCEKFTNL
jgi:hypothetical protein